MITETKQTEFKKKCAYCQKEFFTRRTDKKFCNPSCKARNWDANHIPIRSVVMVFANKNRKPGLLKRILNWVW